MRKSAIFFLPAWSCLLFLFIGCRGKFSKAKICRDAQGPLERAVLFSFMFPCHGLRMKKTIWFAALFVVCVSVSPLLAHEILAKREVEGLSDRDRLAATNAEREVLDRDVPVKSYEWHGPDGASGFIIVGGEYPDHVALGRCRTFIHIIRHGNDGGLNPTFRGKVCRGWDGAWAVE
ncbi:MAG TPA: hypothetical protein PKB01_09845 [Xanthobacteraceae bacterium]|nr:hypothetical protein [Xanthobacteraceae bacterium]